MRLPWLQSDLHPHALSLTEDVAERPDFAGDLAADLAAMSPSDIIHRYRVVARPNRADTALVAAGFSAVRITHILRLGLDAIEAPPLPATLSLHWFKPGERAPWGDWINAHWRHYLEVHLSNPPRAPQGGLASVFVGNDLIYGLAVRDGPQGRVLGFASLREGQELGWVGGGADLLPHILDACLRRAAAIGWTHAELEVDDDDRPLWSLRERLGLPVSDTFVTWHLERTPARRPN